MKNSEPCSTIFSAFISCYKRTLFFYGKLYKQVDEVAMGSPLGPTLTNAFLVYFEQKWSQNCPSDFKPQYSRWYVDDIFILFNSKEH